MNFSELGLGTASTNHYEPWFIARVSQTFISPYLRCKCVGRNTVDWTQAVDRHAHSGWTWEARSTTCFLYGTSK